MGVPNFLGVRTLQRFTSTKKQSGRAHHHAKQWWRSVTSPFNIPSWVRHDFNGYLAIDPWLRTGWRRPIGCLKLRSFSVKEPLIIGLFWGKWPIKIKHPLGLRHPVPSIKMAIPSNGLCCVAAVQVNNTTHRANQRIRSKIIRLQYRKANSQFRGHERSPLKNKNVFYPKNFTTLIERSFEFSGANLTSSPRTRLHTNNWCKRSVLLIPHPVFIYRNRQKHYLGILLCTDDITQNSQRTLVHFWMLAIAKQHRNWCRANCKNWQNLLHCCESCNLQTSNCNQQNIRTTRNENSGVFLLMNNSTCLLELACAIIDCAPKKGL